MVELQQYLQVNRFKEGIFLARPARVDGSARNISNRMKHMIEQLQKLNPRIINANQLRNSVITFWLQQHNLRQVQYMAGHKYVSSTERYQVTLDVHLAELYGVETRALKQAVRRNIERFPADDFMFELIDEEVDTVVSQNVIAHKKYLGGAKPFAFTLAATNSIKEVLATYNAKNFIK